MGELQCSSGYFGGWWVENALLDFLAKSVACSCKKEARGTVHIDISQPLGSSTISTQSQTAEPALPEAKSIALCSNMLSHAVQRTLVEMGRAASTVNPSPKVDVT